MRDSDIAKKVAKLLKGILPPVVFYKIRKHVSWLREVLYPKQLKMELKVGDDYLMQNLRLPKNVTIKTFEEYPEPAVWVSIVNGRLGEWDMQSAKYVFFKDKYFNPALCLFLLENGEPVATASGRVTKNGTRTSGEIHMVAVKDEAKRKGYAYTLTMILIDRLWKICNGSIILRTDDWRLPAIKMYLKIGFTPVIHVDKEDHSERWAKILTQIEHSEHD